MSPHSWRTLMYGGSVPEFNDESAKRMPFHAYPKSYDLATSLYQRTPTNARALF